MSSLTGPLADLGKLDEAESFYRKPASLGNQILDSEQDQGSELLVREAALIDKSLALLKTGNLESSMCICL